ncbi:MAG: ABC transporter ATP-binding protein [Actinobacteria bacterium]|nr:ABC transporter ATP-binding protein [Actinomycetota bacterium]
MIPVLDLVDITKVYGDGDSIVRALDGVSLTVNTGDYLAIMGASGSGKSTLMNIIGALDVATAGQYHLDGIDINTLDEDALSIVRNRKIGFIFQSFNLIPSTTALANVELPLSYRGVKRGERRERARALVAQPSLLLADEPTGNLDSRATADVLKLLDEMHDQGRTIVMITHETEVAQHADRVIVLMDGRISEDRLNR